MNDKTAKLLRRYSQAVRLKESDVKRWWAALPRAERASQRKWLLTEIHKVENAKALKKGGLHV